METEPSGSLSVTVRGEVFPLTVFVEACAARHWVMNYACLVDEVFRGYCADRDAGLGPVLALPGLPPSALPSLLPAPRAQRGAAAGAAVRGQGELIIAAVS